MNDANPVASTDQLRFRLDMNNAPLGKKVLAINPSGVAVFAVLTKETLKDYQEWCELPKRAIRVPESGQ